MEVLVSQFNRVLIPPVTNPPDGFTSLVALQMMERYLEKSEGWSLELVDTWFPLAAYTDTLILGVFSRSNMSKHHKWLHTRRAIHMEYGVLSPAEMARIYLDVKYPDRKPRMTTKQYQEFWSKRRSPPLAVKPCKIDDAVYIDVKSAYWSITKIVGWDVDYSPSRFLGVKSSNTDFPYPEIKLARNSLVSVGLPGSVQIWHGGKVSVQKKGNKYINMVLWGLVQDVLNGIALDMIAAGALYAHTDGFIIPANRIDAAASAIEAWGLDWSIKGQGRAEIRSVGEYTIDGLRGEFRRGTKPHAYWKIYDPDREWLRSRIRFFSERQKLTTVKPKLLL